MKQLSFTYDFRIESYVSVLVCGSFGYSKTPSHLCQAKCMFYDNGNHFPQLVKFVIL